MLLVHRADRADLLSAELARVLVGPATDPLITELVVVPARGMERWLAQRLTAALGVAPGHTDGVCANVAFPSPAQLVADALAAPTGIDRDADPWTVARCCGRCSRRSTRRRTSRGSCRSPVTSAGAT